MKHLLASTSLVALIWAGPAHADPCSDIVLDSAHVISDTSAVAQAAKPLEDAGLTVRIRTFNTVTNDDMDAFVFAMRKQCPSWQVPNGADIWKSTMLLLAYAPPVQGKFQKGAYFGVANSARFGGGKWQDILRDRFVPEARAYNQGEKNGITLAFVNSLAAFNAAYTAPSGSSVTMVQSTDYSSVLKWWLAVSAFGGLAIILIIALRNRAKLHAAQAEARRVRSLCVSGILDITDETNLIVLSTKADTSGPLFDKLTRYKRLGETALQAFSSFDNLNGKDPNSGKLSVDAYNTNRKEYQHIITSYVIPAQHLAKDIQAGETGEPIMSGYTPTGFYHSSSSSGGKSYANPIPPASASSINTTTIVSNNNAGFLTGIIAGEILSSDRSHELRDSSRDYSPPSRNSSSYDSGGSSSSSSSSSSYDSGGSSSSDSSSSSSSSSSDSGGSSSSSSSSSSTC